jgi:hypothetical protein
LYFGYWVHRSRHHCRFYLSSRHDSSMIVHLSPSATFYLYLISGTYQLIAIG